MIGVCESNIIGSHYQQRNSNNNDSRASSTASHSPRSVEDPSSKMNIMDLLAAAEFLERSERQKDNINKRSISLVGGSAPSLISSSDSDNAPKRRKTSASPALSTASVGGQLKAPLAANAIISNTFNRATHNELEKNRRAHLRSCLEKLKELIPLGSDASRHTTLSLLTKATMHIKSLEEQKEKFRLEKAQLLARQEVLKQRAKEAEAEARSLNHHVIATTETPQSIPFNGNERDSGAIQRVPKTNRSRSPSECSASTVSAGEIEERDREVDIIDSDNVSPLASSALTSFLHHQPTPSPPVRAVFGRGALPVAVVTNNANDSILFAMPKVSLDTRPTTSIAVDSTPTTFETQMSQNKQQRQGPTGPGLGLGAALINSAASTSPALTVNRTTPIIFADNFDRKSAVAEQQLRNDSPQFIVPPLVAPIAVDSKTAVDQSSTTSLLTAFSGANAAGDLLASLLRLRLSPFCNAVPPAASPDGTQAAYSPPALSLFTKLSLQTLLDQYAAAFAPVSASSLLNAGGCSGLPFVDQASAVGSSLLLANKGHQTASGLAMPTPAFVPF